LLFLIVIVPKGAFAAWCNEAGCFDSPSTARAGICQKYAGGDCSAATPNQWVGDTYFVFKVHYLSSKGYGTSLSGDRCVAPKNWDPVAMDCTLQACPQGQEEG